ncbi:hypothetical protein N431DRAFT_457877 [Stipitochalara longipes BDJ]|nr:hypothetical protein N431DRAFT_457877 [Stipitochalara longipes BDJ]
MALVELWVLADKLCMPSLQNSALKAIEEISAKLEKVPSITLHYIYEHTSDESPLRRYMVATSATSHHTSFRHSLDEYYPHGMLMELVKYLIKREDGLEKATFTLADYLVKED